ncbi:MAG: response regulator transcription factor [Saprospiraceae bacterium]
MNAIKTIIADDHPIFLQGLRTTLSQNRTLPIEIIGMYNSGQQIQESVSKHAVDLLIMDLNLVDFDGLDLIKWLRNRYAALSIQVLSRYNETKMVKAALQAGANGYILKTGKPEELLQSVHSILNQQTYIGKGVETNEARGLNGQGLRSFEDKFVKKYYLTKREIQILRLITQAKSNKEIAKELYISDQTVSVHRKNIMRKIGVSNTAGLIKTAYDYCLV